ncbi:MAG TPA: hypothetical protein VFA65_24305 [Bryobacteraceae bacterium]|nr:hypothetical protein [Bryobacteraceae bacterium]
MASTSNLAALLGRAYQDRHQSFRTALAEFSGADEELRKHAEAEHDRLVKLEKDLTCPLERRCYVSAQQLKFLKLALAMPVKHEEEMPSKLKALADSAKGVVTDVENAADKAMNRLSAATKKADAGIGKINSIAADIEKSASDIDDFANQTSNFPTDEQ